MTLEPIVGHTPGPWHTHPNDPWEVYVGGPHVGRNMPASERTVCDIRHAGSQRSEANARLIAAAPEYHEAAKQRIARHDAQVRAHGGTECQDEFCNTFRPIVARVEGRQP